MDEHLAEGVVSSLCSNQMRVSTKHQSMIPQVVRWRRNPNAVIMELNVNYILPSTLFRYFFKKSIDLRACFSFLEWVGAN